MPQLDRQVHDALGRLLVIGNWMKVHADSNDLSDGPRLQNLFDVFIDEYQRLAAQEIVHAAGDSPLLVRARLY